MSKQDKKELRQQIACEWLEENYLNYGSLRHDVVTEWQTKHAITRKRSERTLKNGRNLAFSNKIAMNVAWRH